MMVFGEFALRVRFSPHSGVSTGSPPKRCFSRVSLFAIQSVQSSYRACVCSGVPVASFVKFRQHCF